MLHRSDPALSGKIVEADISQPQTPPPTSGKKRENTDKTLIAYNFGLECVSVIILVLVEF